MNTKQLEYVIAISEEKSFSRAADRLLVTQPALSQQVKSWKKSWVPNCFAGRKMNWCLQMRERCM